MVDKNIYYILFYNKEPTSNITYIIFTVKVKGKIWKGLENIAENMILKFCSQNWSWAVS